MRVGGNEFTATFTHCTAAAVLGTIGHGTREQADLRIAGEVRGDLLLRCGQGELG